MPTRVLAHYPPLAARNRALAVVVLVTITLYYALYVKGSVAPQIIDEFDMSLTFYVTVSIIGNLLGAFAALAGGVTDRLGRSRLVLTGTAAVAALTLVAVPLTWSKQSFLVADVAQTTVLGAVLVATPALIRDFAPQLNRATAMCTFNLGPILGSLLVSSIASNTLDAHPAWRFQFYVCGSVVTAAFGLALIGLRELSPELRAQLVVSGRNPDAVDAQADALVNKPAAPGDWRQLMRPRLIIPVVAISLFLFFYFTRLAYWVIYFVTTYGFTPAEANSISNWWWATSAITLTWVGLLSDRLGVRKPLMLVGAVVSASALAVFGSRAGDLTTSYDDFVVVIVPAALGGVMCFGMWLTAFSEAIERINPALVATGMGIYGWVVRLTAASALVSVLFVVDAADVLVDHGARVQELSTTYAAQIDVIQHGNAAESRAAQDEIPAADLDYLVTYLPQVLDAAEEGPGQWQEWWRICLVMQLGFIPAIWLLPGPWRPRRRRI